MLAATRLLVVFVRYGDESQIIVVGGFVGGTERELNDSPQPRSEGSDSRTTLPIDGQSGGEKMVRSERQGSGAAGKHGRLFGGERGRV